MYIVVTRSFPPEVGGMQNLMWGLTNSLSKYHMIKVFADYQENHKEFDNNENFSITDISHSRAVIQVKGFQSREILKKGSPINFNDFQKNYSVGTVFHGINIIIDLVDDNPDTFNLLTLRSFGETF